MDEIKITTTITEEKYIRYNFYTLEKYHKIKLQYNLTTLLGVICIIGGLFTRIWYALLLMGIYFILIRFLHKRRVVKTIKKNVKDSPMILGNGEITINKDEIIEKSEISTTTIKWKDLYAIEIDHDMIYLFFSKLHAFIIETELLSDQELDQLMKWIDKSEK